MKCLLILEEDNGCDYTIGCGMTTLEFEASDMNEAMEKSFPEMVEQHGDPATGYINEDIARATLYCISDHRGLDLEQYRHYYKECLAEHTTMQTEVQERAELKRLKRKYGS